MHYRTFDVSPLLIQLRHINNSLASAYKERCEESTVGMLVVFFVWTAFLTASIPSVQADVCSEVVFYCLAEPGAGATAYCLHRDTWTSAGELYSPSFMYNIVDRMHGDRNLS
eukprot:m.250375 g.250375  ORF g.250375 m.250375 type:complete len:112 (+) comp40320_c0_seq10:413-748(+)